MNPKVRCQQCNNQVFCGSCDDMYHRHPKRKTHIRKVVFATYNYYLSILLSKSSFIIFKIIEIPQQQNIKPPLPPKGEIPLPVPPPRRNKRGIFSSPGGKDQVRTCVIA